MADDSLMSAISGLGKSKEGEKPREEKPKGKAKKPKVVNLGKGGSFEIKRPGDLHKRLGVAQGKTIPEAKLDAALHSQNATTRHEAASAKGLKAMKKD